jgi:hypothetical protein
MERNNFALRLLPSLYRAASRIAAEENCSINQLINLALAEKIALLDEARIRERQLSRAKPELARAAIRLLERKAGKEPLRPGDELPQISDSHSRRSARRATSSSTKDLFAWEMAGAAGGQLAGMAAQIQGPSVIPIDRPRKRPELAQLVTVNLDAVSALGGIA